MALTNQESERLQEEARQLYERYGELKVEIRADRSQTKLQSDLENVQSRYHVVVEELRQLGSTSDEPDFQIPDFDVGHYRAHKPIVSHPDDNDGHVDRIFRMLKPRKVISLLLAIFLVCTLILISDKTIGFFVVPSSSMEPTLVPGDKLVTFRKTEYERGDVVVIRDPDEEGVYLVKRLIAKENDDIYVHQGTIIVNGIAVSESYINEPIDYEFEAYHIPDGQIFVLGDNRNYSDDGHKWGHGISMDKIVGEVRYVYAPRHRARTIPSGSEQFFSAGL